MTSSWTNIRYWAAICASLLLALIAFSGLGMGPSSGLGWTVFALCLAAPVAVWWTRWSRAARWLQYIALALVALIIIYVAAVTN